MGGRAGRATSLPDATAFCVKPQPVLHRAAIFTNVDLRPFEVLSAARRPFMVKSCCFQVRTVRGDFFQQTAEGHARRDLEGGVAVEPVKGGHLLILPGAIAVNIKFYA